MTKISVIIPCYNAEKYLRECLDSVINQTLKDIEIICVNDGSTDKSLEILQYYAQKDNRVIVIDKENEGVGKTRNIGIKQSKSEFVIFMDPDDIYPDNDILETLYIKAKENDVLICGGEFSDYVNGKISQNYPRLYGYLFEKNGLIDYKDYQFDYGYHRFIYNREFLIKNNIFFPNYKRYQDPPFFVKAMIKAGKFYAVDKITYGYRMGHNTVKWTKEKVLDNLKAFSEVILLSGKYNLEKLKDLEVHRLLYEYLPIFTGNISIFSKFELVKLCFINRQIRKRLIRKYVGENILSVKNSTDKKHKIIKILGIKIKIKRTKYIKQQEINKLNLIYSIYQNGINKEKINYEIENFEDIGITKEKRKQKLIVSLTSYPDRMYDLHYSIYSLLNQSLKPDEVILWLGKEQFLDKKISRKVLDLQKNGLTIKWCDDIKSYTKLIPALQEYPNDIIVTADDDIFYEKDWLKDLYEEYLENPNYIHAKRVHKFSLNKSYNSWQQLINDNTISFFNFLTGVGGVLYPPNLLYKDVLNKDLFMELSPNGDDILFWAMALLQGTKIKVCKKPMNTLRYTTPEREYGLYDEKTLCSLNCGQNQNDKQIESVLNHFPKIIEVLKNDKS